jgi:hypothetical protein
MTKIAGAEFHEAVRGGTAFSAQALNCRCRRKAASDTADLITF